MNYPSATTFHGYLDTEPKFRRHRLGDMRARITRHVTIEERELSYRFDLHQHPFVQALTQRLIRRGVRGLQAADTEYVRKADGSFETLPDGDGKFRPVLHRSIFSPGRYDPSELVDERHPVEELDFSTGGAYAIYNWELFFHVPLTIAIHLSKNQRFAEAQKWFHYVFDPTDDSDGPTPERYWKVRPFQHTDVKRIEEILINLATGADPALRNDTVRAIEAARDMPFRPHVVARYRQQAYMYKAVMAYLDNLIAWGDSLFRQDTPESVDEALQLYVLAANILGPRPQAVPTRGRVRPQTYANLRADLDAFANALRDMEAELQFDLMPFPGEPGADGTELAPVRGLGKALYFCVPRNDKLLGYWDTVADRLFKIRNSLNILGVFRRLPLFAPPIDPALLARAAAAGVDVGAITSGLNQPLPLVRFAFLVQKAAEICQEVRSLGGQLLAAMEKEDNEALAILRAKHERAVLDMVEHVRYRQLQEAVKAKEALLQSLALAVQRHTYYERQLGEEPGDVEQRVQDAVQALGELDRPRLDSLQFTMNEPEISPRDIEVDIVGELADAGGTVMSSYESHEFDALAGAQFFLDSAAVIDTLGSGLSAIPQTKIDLHYWGIGGTIEFGGYNLHNIQAALSSAARGFAGNKSYEAGKSARIGSYARREQEWAFQSNQAASEISQIFKQLRAAQLREAIAEQELDTHRRQMQHAEEIERFLNAEGSERSGKKTHKTLYAWMKREVKGLYAQCFQLAFDIAKKAERALQHELGDPNLGFIQFGYLAGKEGLLAGDKLYFDIKRMEMAYHELNAREYELTKHVSLLQVDPLALIQLRTTGSCTVHLPEEVFDMDGPGHYFRRIRSVAVSIPCVTGPYASVNCTLTLLKSSIRTTPVLKGLNGDGGYAREEAEDDRFSDYFGSLQSIVTSSGQNDSGLFEVNLRDERYLPFENFGVISEWQLGLPADPSKGDPRQFDHDTISDVILHVRYTAREGGDLLRRAALEHLERAIKQARAIGSVRLFAVRHEFPTEWARFSTQAADASGRFELRLKLRPEHYPFWSQGYLKNVRSVTILSRSSEAVTVAFDGEARPLDQRLGDIQLGVFTGDTVPLSSPVSPEEGAGLLFNTSRMSDLWLAITWGGA